MRRIILDELTDRDGQTLFEICGRLTMKHGLASSRQAVSQHPAVLEQAGLVHPATGPVQVPPHRHEPAALDRRAVGHRRRGTGPMIRINITSTLVDDQAKALAFYSEKLGFAKKRRISDLRCPASWTWSPAAILGGAVAGSARHFWLTQRRIGARRVTASRSRSGGCAA